MNSMVHTILLLLSGGMQGFHISIAAALLSWTSIY